MPKCENLGAENDEGNTEFKWKLIAPTAERIQHLITQQTYRITEGNGICFYQIGVKDDGNPIGFVFFLLSKCHSLHFLRKLRAKTKT